MNNLCVLPIFLALAACAAAPVVPHVPPPPRTESLPPLAIDEPERSERHTALEPGTRVAAPEFPWLRRYEARDYDTMTSAATTESTGPGAPEVSNDAVTGGDGDVVTWGPGEPYAYYHGYPSQRHHVVFVPPPPELVWLTAGLGHELHHDLHRAMARGAVHAAHALRGLFRALH